VGWGVKKAGKVVEKSFELAPKTVSGVDTLLRMARGREFQVVGAATAKLREPKHVRTRGTNNSLESDERKARDGM